MASYTREELKNAVESSNNFAEVIRKLNLSDSGTLRKYLYLNSCKWLIPTTHFDPYAHTRYKKRTVPLEEILVEGRKYKSERLKLRLVGAGILTMRCYYDDCPTRNINHWRGNEITYHLDHIDGNNKNNKLENLRILCIMCHSHTPTYGGKNIKNKQKKIAKRCADCGKAISRSAMRCGPCAGLEFNKKNIKLSWPPNEILLKLYETFGSYAEVARQLNIKNGSAVQKRIKRIMAINKTLDSEPDRRAGSAWKADGASRH